MASTLPIARHFVACADVIKEIDTATQRMQFTLRRLQYQITLRPDERLPIGRTGLTFFVLLTDGRGEHEFALEWAQLQHGEERVLSRTQGQRVNLGQDPAAAKDVTFRIKQIVFSQRGQYTFYLLCDGNRIAHEHVEVQ